MNIKQVYFLYLLSSLLEILIWHFNKVFVLIALIDSRADRNFMKLQTAQQLIISLIKLNNDPNIQAIDGGVIGQGKVTHGPSPTLLSKIQICLLTPQLLRVLLKLPN